MSVVWTAQQEEFFSLCQQKRHVGIVGAPGTGKTASLEEAVARLAESAPHAKIAFITQDRRAAADSLIRVTRRCGGISHKIEVRSLAAFCYAVVQEFAEQTGRERPELISGPEEDALIREIITQGGVSFPAAFTEETTTLAAFRSELRNLLVTSVEMGISSDELEEYASQYEEPLWASVAQLRRIYEQRLENMVHEGASLLLEAHKLDHAHLVVAATNMIAAWKDEVAQFNRSSKKVEAPQWDWVFVDDIQNAPRSILSLLHVLAAQGACIVTAGDPDASVQGFRGAAYSLPLDVMKEKESLGSVPMTFNTTFRGGKSIRSAAFFLSQHIRGGSVEARKAPAGEYADTVAGYRYVNAEEEAAGISRLIRQWHLREGVAYSDIAIVTRSRGLHSYLRAELMRRSIPVAPIASDIPLWRQPVVIHLMRLISLAIDKQSSYAQGRDILFLLEGLLWGCDSLTVRRIGRQLRRVERENGGRRNETELFTAAVIDGEEHLLQIPDGAIMQKLHHSIERIRRVYGESSGNAEQVLWAAWDSCGKSEQWRRDVIEATPYADSSGTHLDILMQLFRFAQRLADRSPDVSYSEFIEELRVQELPQDSIAKAGISLDTVTLTTPASSQGKQWKRVIIARLNEGVWPNMTIRDPLTHSTRLVGLLSESITGYGKGREYYREEYRSVLDDETRQLYHCVGLAQESLIVTCVDGEEDTPSRLIRALGFAVTDTEMETVNKQGTPLLALPAPARADFDEYGLVGTLRRYASCEGDVGVRAREILSNLAQGGLASAQPALWLDSAETTTMNMDKQEKIYISPSNVESLLECPLAGSLRKLDFHDTSSKRKARYGTIIHEIAEKNHSVPEGLSYEDFKGQLLADFDEKISQMNDYSPEAWDRKEEEEYRAIVETLALYIFTYAGEAQKVEYSFKVDTGMAIVAGTIDRISSDGHDSVRIEDYKTGSVISEKKAEDNVQLHMYQWALEREQYKSPVSGAQLVYLGKKLKAGNPTIRDQKPLTSSTIERTEKRIAQAEVILRSASLPTKENQKCEKCTYRSVCPRMPEGRIFS